MIMIAAVFKWTTRSIIRSI